MKRLETFVGIENQFPEELRDIVRELCRRLEAEMDNIVSYLNNLWNMTRYSESVVEAPGAGRVYVEYPDGSREPVTADFGQQTEDSP